ncbi:MAG: tetratricopeptide repeat protein [Deltaproteobacteria bacterium]|nr:tetratricopeptide repeat protein [Deltaproteobacteria bacterium]
MKRVFPLFLILLLFAASCTPSYLAPYAAIEPQKGPLSFEEHLKLGTIYEQKGMLKSAVEEYKKAAELNSTSARPYFGMGNIHLALKRYGEAEADFRKAIDIDSTQGVYYNNLGWVYMETGRLIEAQTMVTRGLTLDIQNQYIYLDTLGLIETRFNNYEGAENLLKRAAADIPVTDIRGLIHIYTHLYELYLISGKTRQAEETRKKLDDLTKGIAPLLP